jgi:hypothetical protein
MRRFHSTIVFTICVLTAAVAAAQAPAAPATSAKTSEAQAAIDRAAKANKYVFLFFWKDKGDKTDKAWGLVQTAIAKMADKADVVAIQISDPAEKKVVDKYGASRAPMPTVLAVAPSGPVTKGFTKTFDEKELRTAFVSPCTERCMKAIQSGKVVFVCVVDKTNPKEAAVVPQGVKDFKADEKYGPTAEIVMLNVRDAAEADFLKDLEVGVHAAPLTVFLAPGALIGKFGSEATKEVLLAKLAAAQEACGPGCSCHH